VLNTMPAHANVFTTFPAAWPRMEVQVSKVGFRLGQNFEISQGNHNVEAYPFDALGVGVAAVANFYLFHFPTRTVDQLRRKLINGNSALASTNPNAGLENTASHWRTYYQWYLANGDAALEGILRDHIASCAAP
jgi:hypothetical protein